MQDLIGALLVDSSEINFTYTDATPSITAALINASITFARLQNFDALSVLGRSANSSGVSDEIAAGANDRLLRRTGDTLNFGQLTAGMFPNTVVPDAALSSNAALLNRSPQTFTGSNVISSADDVASFKLLGATGGFRFRPYITSLSTVDLDIINTAETLLLPFRLAASTMAFVTVSTGTFADFTFNGVAATDFARLSQPNAFSTSPQSITQASGQRGLLIAAASGESARLALDAPGGGIAWEVRSLTGGNFEIRDLDLDLARLTIAVTTGAVSFGTKLNLQSTRPQFEFSETGATADEGRWIWDIDGDTLVFELLSDAGGSGTSVFRIERSGNAATLLQFSAASITLSGTGETLATFVDDGACTFYHNNTARIATSATGVDMVAGTFRLFGYTVATLPAGTIGDTAYVTDAAAPVFGAAVVGGGAVMVPVYYTGAAWFVG